MAIAPIDYTTGNGFGQGLQLAGLYQQVQQQKAAAAKAQADQEALKAFQNDWQSAYGDPAKMDALVAKYPGQLDTIKNAIGFRDDNHRMALGNAARDLRVAMASNNPQAIQQAATQHAQALSSIGSSPQDVMEQLRSNPQGLAQTIDAVGMSALGAKDFYNVQNDRAQRQNDADRNAETARSNRASEAITMRGQDVSRANSLTAAYAPTSAMQNYNQYTQMLKSDPEGARAFASASGINPDQKKLFKVETMPDGSVTKYYADGTEERGKASDPITDANMRKPLTVREADGILSKASEGSKQAAGFAMRVEDGLSGMRQLVDSGQVSPQRAAFIAARLGDGMIANNALSPSEQSYLLHARDTVNAVLRKDTGAAITEAETKEYANLYLPQPGESDAALKVKNRKLENRFKTFRGESGLSYEAMKVSSKAYDAQDAAQQPQQSVQQQSQPRQAPAAAIQALQNNPTLAQQFQEKYGYLP